MTATFGHRWTSAYGADHAEGTGAVWALELAGLGRRSIERGLAASRRTPDGWPPTLPEFRAFCLGVLPLPTVDANLTEAPAKWHPFSVLVKRQINESAWRMSGPDGQRHMLERAYERARAHVIAGGKLPEYIPADLQLTAEDHQEPPPPIMLTVDQAMAEIRKSLRVPSKTESASPAEPAAEPELPPACIRCTGSLNDPLGGPCKACFGSGMQRSYNSIVGDDGEVVSLL